MAVAGTVAYVAWQQWKTNDDRLRLELFDRRFAIYDATRQFLLHYLASSSIGDTELRTFWSATRDAEFLFDYDVSAAVIDRVSERAKEHRRIMRLLERMSEGEQRDTHYDRLTEIDAEMVADFERLQDRFRPYLRIARRP